MMRVDEGESSVLHPKIWAKVIDFGNAFEMKEGELVSVKWMTGARILIPPEVLACKETNYNPYSYNPHQMAVNGISILLT